ncbi:MAG: ABC transporter permease [Eubacterium sp.]|jgi:cell division transport system permease protein|nr:ABC transporter permease [Eubacterium sp.]
MKWNNMTYLVRQGITSIWHNRMMSFASFCIIMVSLLLFGLSGLVAYDFNTVIGNIEDKNEIIVFVKNEVSPTDAAHIGDVIKSNPLTEKVVFRTKEEAWEIQREKMGEQYFVLFDYLDENPMPSTYIVSINNIGMIEKAVADYGEIEGVEQVKAPYDFAHFLTSMRGSLGVIGTAVLAALIVVCLVIVYNTTRTSVFSRRMEISIMKHVGATNSFIKIPFFLEGMLIGIIAGIVSWLLTKAAYESVLSLFSADVSLWDILGMANILKFSEVKWLMLALNCIAGAFIGALGTVFSMGKHLKV